VRVAHVARHRLVRQRLRLLRIRRVRDRRSVGRPHRIVVGAGIRRDLLPLLGRDGDDV